MTEVTDLHVPVMLERCLELLRPAIAGKPTTVIDATLGLGGHTEALLREHPELTVIGIDRDPVALELATDRLAVYADRFTPVLATYDQIDEILAGRKVDGILMDLGVSSMQLDQADRGFSYAKDAYLDMRMDQTTGKTAADLLAELDVSSLARMFRSYGEERFSLPIAKRIVQRRASFAITNSSQLNQIVAEVVPVAPGKQSGHPAKRVYQALRIAVNDELGVLESAMPQAIDALVVGGRLVVMSYHSLEDGIVKDAMQDAATSKTPVDMPVELPGTAATFKILTRGVERASERELEQNPRAASARLRAGEKLKGN